MAMQIHGSYDPSQTSYAEKLREKQAAERAEKEAKEAKEAEKAANTKEAEKAADAKGSGRRPQLQDAYISSEEEGQKPTGLYRVEQDEKGNRKIVFDDPKKAGRTEESEEPKKASRGEEKEEPKEEICVGNTNGVDREIQKLKEKKQQLEQQIQSASGDERKTRKLQKKLAQIEQELSQKDTETYRRQHTVFS